MAELLASEAEDLFDVLVDVLVLGGEHVLLIALLVEGPEGGAGLRGFGALAPELGAFLLGRARDPVAIHADPEVQGDAGFELGVCEIRAQALAVSVCAGRLSVERETDGIEQGGFAAAGGAVDQEQAVVAELVEVQVLATGVRTEGVHAEFQRPHDASSRSEWRRDCITSWKTFSPPSMSSLPVTSL